MNYREWSVNERYKRDHDATIGLVLAVWALMVVLIVFTGCGPVKVTPSKKEIEMSQGLLKELEALKSEVSALKITVSRLTKQTETLGAVQTHELAMDYLIDKYGDEEQWSEEGLLAACENLDTEVVWDQKAASACRIFEGNL